MVAKPDLGSGAFVRMGSSPFARTSFRDWGVLLGLFFFACGSCLEKRSGPRGLVPLCHCVTSPEGERKRLSPFRSLARFLEIVECSSVSFKPSCGVISGKLSGRTPHSTDKLCVLLTLSGLKRFLTYKLLIVIVMSLNNRFNQDIITHINFSREHPYRVSVLCFQVRNHP